MVEFILELLHFVTLNNCFFYFSCFEDVGNSSGWRRENRCEWNVFLFYKLLSFLPCRIKEQQGGKEAVWDGLSAES
jgi:hypothetical protein